MGTLRWDRERKVLVADDERIPIEVDGKVCWLYRDPEGRWHVDCPPGVDPFSLLAQVSLSKVADFLVDRIKGFFVPRDELRGALEAWSYTLFTGMDELGEKIDELGDELGEKLDELGAKLDEIIRILKERL